MTVVSCQMSFQWQSYVYHNAMYEEMFTDLPWPIELLASVLWGFMLIINRREIVS